MSNNNLDDNEVGQTLPDSDDYTDNTETTETLDTMTELTGTTTGGTGDSSASQDYLNGDLPATGEDETAPTSSNRSKKKSKLPLFLGGGVVVAAIAAGSFFMAGNSSQQAEPEQAQQASEVVAPTLEQAASQAETEQASKVTEPVPTETASQPEQVQPQPTPAPVEQAASQAEPKLPVPTEQAQTPAQQPAPTPAPQNAQQPVQQDTAMPTPVEPQLPTPVEQNQATANQAEQPAVDPNKTRAQELREEAQRMLDEARALEKTNRLDAELQGKTLEEQVAYLKDKVTSLSGKACVTPQKKSSNHVIRHGKKGVVKSTAKVAKAEKISGSYEVKGIVEGQIWVKSGNGGSRSYAVGEKLPNGSTIKNINYENRTITTTNGTFKVNG